MKSYKKMAEDVLHRAEVYTVRKKRNQRIAVTAAAFGCLSMLIAVNIIKIGSQTNGDALFVEQPSIQMDNHTPQVSKPTWGTKPQEDMPIVLPGEDTFGDHGIVLLAARTMTAQGTPLEHDLELPLNYSLRVRDFRGASELERLKAELEERELYKAMMDEGLGGASMKLGNCTNRENYMISFVRTGCFRLWIKDRTSVERISIKSTTNYGKIDVSLSNNTFPTGNEVTLLPEDIPEWDWKHGLRINWKYSNAVLEALDENPSRPLSEFSDLLVFAVEFSDGSMEECEVELLILDNGEVMARLQSAQTLAK